MSDVVILAVDDAGDRPFPQPAESVDDDQVTDWHVGAKVPSTTGQGANGDRASYRTTKEPATTSTRGTRLPEDFTVDESMRSWYAENIGRRIDGVAEHEKFMDYWRAATGRNATKKDWVAAWRNWMRTAVERSGTRRNGSERRPAAGYQSAAERSHSRLMEERDLLLIAEEIVEREGGDPERDKDRVEAVYRQLRDQSQNGSAPRTSGTYSRSEGWIDGEVVPQREVTAGEEQ